MSGLNCPSSAIGKFLGRHHAWHADSYECGMNDNNSEFYRIAGVSLAAASAPFVFEWWLALLTDALRERQLDDAPCVQQF